MAERAEPGIEHTIGDRVGWVSISNPARRNALTATMMADLAAVAQRLDADPGVRTIVLRGAGDTFSAGADLTELQAHQGAAGARQIHSETVTRLFGTLSELSTPLIAMIHGHCLGAGMALALTADLRIAAHGSRYAIPAARLGIGYPVPLGQRLVHLVGPSHASDILLTGRTLTDDEAHAAGLVNRLVPEARLEAEVGGLASIIAANAPLSVRAAKATIGSALRPRLVPQANDLVSACAGSEDEREGQRAFAERRPPVYTGR